MSSNLVQVSCVLILSTFVIARHMALQRGAHGVILVYDVTKRASFDALKEIWLKEVSMYSTRPAVIKMIVGNKVDLPDREVSREEGIAFARQHSTLFVESSAKTAVGVRETFEELVRKILQTPELCSSSSRTANGSVLPGVSSSATASYSDCSC
jgi:Ras-related protein Rab-18